MQHLAIILIDRRSIVSVDGDIYRCRDQRRMSRCHRRWSSTSLTCRDHRPALAGRLHGRRADVAQGAIIFDEVRRLEQLPIGWTDEQEGGTYRLKRRDDGAYFGYAVGPHSWKKYLFPSRMTLFTIEQTANSFAVHGQPGAGSRYAFLGARSCDLHAIEIQDRVFLRGPICRSALSGPPRAGIHHRGELWRGRGDVFLHEHENGPEGGSRFRPGADRAGRTFRGRGGHRPRARDHGGRSLPRGRPAPDLGAAARVVRDTESQITRRLDTSDLPELLYNNLEHARWDDVAERCLSCTNCTMVCPTCFCHSIEDVPDLDGQRSERVRLWDSCFNFDHAHTAGGNMRPDIRSRVSPVADAQAGLLDRSISACRDAWAAGGASRGARWRSTSPRKWPPSAAERRHDDPLDRTDRTSRFECNGGRAGGSRRALPASGQRALGPTGGARRGDVFARVSRPGAPEPLSRSAQVNST